MKTIGRAVLWVLLACHASTATAQFAKNADVVVRVVDEQNNPVSGVSTTVSFDVMNTSNPFDGTGSVEKTGETDAGGFWNASSKTMGRVHVSATKIGYYKSSTNHTFLSVGESWNAVFTVRVIKKTLPISMYAKKIERLVVPILGSPVGFDFKEADWVSPYGKGVVSDIVFKVDRQIRGGFDFGWRLDANLPGEGNGLCALSPAETTPESELRFPRIAPADGYNLKGLFSAFESTANSRWQTNSTTATNFFFRVRTEYDHQKQVTNAFHGKLLGPISVNVQATKSAKLYFTYYLNPTSLDRNMEFDPKQNLFKNLRPLEQVAAP